MIVSAAPQPRAGVFGIGPCLLCAWCAVHLREERLSRPEPSERLRCAVMPGCRWLTVRLLLLQIEHWVMWYDPALVPGGTDLDPSAFATHVLSVGRTRRPWARPASSPLRATLCASSGARSLPAAALLRTQDGRLSCVGPRHIWRRPRGPGLKPPASVNVRCALSWTWATPSAAAFRTFPSGAACRRSRTRTSSCGHAGRRRRRRSRSCGPSGGCAARGPRPSV